MIVLKVERPDENPWHTSALPSPSKGIFLDPLYWSRRAGREQRENIRIQPDLANAWADLPFDYPHWKALVHIYKIHLISGGERSSMSLVEVVLPMGVRALVHNASNRLPALLSLNASFPASCKLH